MQERTGSQSGLRSHGSRSHGRSSRSLRRMRPPRGGSATRRHGSITCSVFSGKVKFTPPLVPTPDASQKVKVSGTVSDCTTSGVAATVSSGEVIASGIFNLTSEGPDLCSNLTDFSVFPTQRVLRHDRLDLVTIAELGRHHLHHRPAPCPVGRKQVRDRLDVRVAGRDPSKDEPRRRRQLLGRWPHALRGCRRVQRRRWARTMTLTTPSFSPLLSLG